MPRQRCARIRGERLSEAPSFGRRLLSPGIKRAPFLVSEKSADTGLAFPYRTQARAQTHRAHIVDQEQ